MHTGVRVKYVSKLTDTLLDCTWGMLFPGSFVVDSPAGLWYHKPS